jgi:hypothetical protein
MNAEQVEAFRAMAAQLDALHQEASAAAKKAPDKSVSAFKINLANNILKSAKAVLGKSAPVLGFESFDIDDLPTNSDLSFVVTQFVECAEKVRSENVQRLHNGVWYWTISGAMSQIAAAPPRGSK